MSDGIYVALSGAIAQQRTLDVVANNVANANTVAFRASRVSFTEALRGAAPPAAGDPLRFVAVSEVRPDDSPGALQVTGSSLDLAIEGDAFFVVGTPEGERLTRAGSFVRTAEGDVTTPLGYPLRMVGTETPLRVPANARTVEVGTRGEVRVDGQPAGTIRLVQIEDASALVQAGSNLFSTTPGTTPTLSATASIRQGALEGSNTNAVTGLTELVNLSRGFDAFQRVIAAFKDIDQRTARDLAARNG